MMRGKTHREKDLCRRLTRPAGAPLGKGHEAHEEKYEETTATVHLMIVGMAVGMAGFPLPQGKTETLTAASRGQKSHLIPSPQTIKHATHWYIRRYRGSTPGRRVV